MEQINITNLVSIKEYAELIGKTVSWVNQLTEKRPEKGGIIPEIVGTYKLIDISKYPPDKFKKK